jgi:hypothetical protein
MGLHLFRGDGANTGAMSAGQVLSRGSPNLQPVKDDWHTVVNTAHQSIR